MPVFRLAPVQKLKIQLHSPLLLLIVLRILRTSKKVWVRNSAARAKAFSGRC
jgi:hypothetical protein